VVLVDTSVWVEHLRKGSPTLKELLGRGQVATHPFVIGELALGNLRQRDAVLSALAGLPQARTAAHDEVMLFIDRHKLSGKGVGYLDVHLLASVKLTPGACLWTLDKRLASTAESMGLAPA
jgi:predicted nucleic acid-binding protein